MAIGIPLLIGANSQSYSVAATRFINMSLNLDQIRPSLEPIIDLICRNVEFVYKSPSRIEFISATNAQTNYLSESMQFDEVAVKLLLTDSAHIIYINIGTCLVRKFIIRMLRTSLLDDEDPGVLLSSTEKGIFSFMIARLMSEMKKSLGDSMPNIKILSIYHAQDDILKSVDIKPYSLYNFKFEFSAEVHPLTLYAPIEAFNFIIEENLDVKKLLARAGHVKRDLSLIVHKLTVKPIILTKMNKGDVILFDKSTLSINHGSLRGTINGIWANWSCLGLLTNNNHYYRFQSHSSLKNHQEDEIVEELHLINDQEDHLLEDSPHKLKHLAKNIRVSLNIELSRIPMSLYEISKLKGGEIIDLKRKIDEPLDMVVDNIVIGQCMPVQIDANLGIRILNISGGNDKDHN